ncbi:sensor histidine kinase [Radiobacillus sp. PE A8.2]|uniref:sensor histidine kinase n=1 Tax=Radiobacillus sp. PE A8.2 TaxID=3380349 RepID=UPI00388D75AF
MLAYNIAKDKIVDSVSYSSTQLNASLAERFNQMKNAADVMEYHMYTLILQPDSSLSRQLTTYSNVRNSLFNLSSTFNFGNISVYSDERFIFSNEGITFFSFDDLQNRNLSLTELVPKANENNWEVMQNIKEPFIKYNSNASQDYISIFKPFQLANSDQIEYVYFIDIPVNEIEKVLKERELEDSINIFITDEQGESIIGEANHLQISTIKNVLNSVTSEETTVIEIEDTTVITIKNPVTQWRMITEVPNKYIRSNTKILISILLTTLILTVLIAIISSLFISNNLSKRVNKIASILDHYKNKKNGTELTNVHLPVLKKKQFHDEFDRLSLVFNEMSNKMNHDFEKILEMKAIEEKMQFELQQAKINPHFLYNILDSIKSCQSSGNIQEANKMITRLAKFYRLLLRKEEELILIKDELEIVQLFMEIESINKENIFTWDIKTDDMIENFLIPKFVLQPIIENAIKHGISNCKEKLYIQINISYDDNYILVNIQDNGDGIEQHNLKDLNQTLTSKTVDSENFFGISNVNFRLTRFSNHQDPLQITSQLHGGTTVEIRIDPMLPESEID